MEIGVMFWADAGRAPLVRESRDDFSEILSLGVRCGQLGIGGSIHLTPEFASDWKTALAREHFSIATVVCAYEGESYADIATVERTVGFIPRSTRDARERRTMQVSDFAAILGVPGIACHIGFIPGDRTSPDYAAMIDVTRRICGHAACHGQTFALETGQEPAESLLHFLEDAARDNLKINFDPANMILYGTGDPIQAFELLAKHVVSIHAKDGDWPTAPGQLGVERPLGSGSVNILRFIDALKRHRFNGILAVEREIDDQPRRLAEIRAAVSLLGTLI